VSNTETPTVASVKELHRSRDDRVLAGVAGGLGTYFDLSPTFFRVGFALLTLVGGAGILLYVAAAIVIPDEGQTDSIASEALRRHRDQPWLLLGVALVGIAVLSLVAQAHFWPNSGFAWILLLLGGLAIVLAQRRADRSVAPPAPPDTSNAVPETSTTAVVRQPRRPSLFVPTVGALLALGGLLALLSALGVDVRWDLALAVGAIGTGVVVVAGALLRRRTGGLVLVGLFLTALAIGVSAIDVRLEGPIGDRTYRPAAADDVKHTYDMSVGNMRLDLSSTTLAAGETQVDANLGVGNLRVVVPQDVAVDVDGTVSAGHVEVFGREDDGFDAEVTARAAGSDSSRVLRLDAHTGIGNVVVTRER
jgi:phage shock protein PspC (stress-responsive transcriptional regulator)